MDAVPYHFGTAWTTAYFRVRFVLCSTERKTVRRVEYERRTERSRVCRNLTFLGPLLHPFPQTHVSCFFSLTETASQNANLMCCSESPMSTPQPYVRQHF